ncbi:MAG: hypothetical protein NT016_01705 [Candidatus Aenigmarchaeota archaeon]|nr:hypothetical protein [Candidatus Aenigmarchaeota archaeon]
MSDSKNVSGGAAILLLAGLLFLAYPYLPAWLRTVPALTAIAALSVVTLLIFASGGSKGAYY